MVNEETKPETEEIEKNPQEEKESSPEEDIDEQIEKLQAKKEKLHLKEEKQKLKDIECPSCGNKLSIKPEDFLKRGSKAVELECKECERLNRVQITYKDDPKVADARITVTPGEFAWNTGSKLPGELDKKHVKRWMEEEHKKIMNLESRLPRYMQITIRHVMEK